MMKIIRRLDGKRIKLEIQSPLILSDASLSSPGFVDMFADDDDDDDEILYTSKLVPKDRDHQHHHNLRSPPDTNFIIPEDVLATEILPRVANRRTAIRCSAVSKHWNSLVTAAEFVPNFLRLHPRPPYAMFVEFRFGSREIHTTRQLCPGILRVAVEGSNVTVGSASDYNLSRNDKPLALDSACDDFLLLSRISTDQTRHLYIHKPVSGLWLRLPNPPLRDPFGFSAMVSRRDSTPSRYSFRVVYFNGSAPSEFRVTVFSSETGRWSDPSPAHELPRKLDPVAANGLLYWLDNARHRRLVIFDPFSSGDRQRFVDFPADLVLPSILLPGNYVGPVEEIPQPGSDKKLPLLGVVQGRVRVAQLVREGGVNLVMKVWELSCDNSAWGPVSEVRVSYPPVRGFERLHLFWFHPEERDVVFLCCGRDVYSYCLSRGKYKRVLTLSCRKGEEDLTVRDRLPHFAHVLTVSLPLWPTATIPALSS